MPDREKVIATLTACARGNITCKQSGCPYWGEEDDCIGKMARDALELMKEQELVRCKDCKHHHHNQNQMPYCDKHSYGWGWKDDDFCSYAERR